MKEPFQAVRIKSRDEFEWLIEHLTHEAFRVRDHWEVWGALDRSLDRYWEELNQTPNFWELTRRAHQDIVVLRLGRLFDPHAAAISLGSLLQTMKENAVAPSPLLAAVASLDLSELDKDMSSVSDGDAKVRKLLTLRNEYLAHRDSRHVARGTFVSLPVLEREEVASLLDRALEILQRYRERLGFRPLGWGHYEVREFEMLLELLHAGLQSRRGGG